MPLIRKEQSASISQDSGSFTPCLDLCVMTTLQRMNRNPNKHNNVNQLTIAACTCSDQRTKPPPLPQETQRMAVAQLAQCLKHIARQWRKERERNEC
jgi:hypothetical protein